MLPNMRAIRRPIYQTVLISVAASRPQHFVATKRRLARLHFSGCIERDCQNRTRASFDRVDKTNDNAPPQGYGARHDSPNDGTRTFRRCMVSCKELSRVVF